MCAVLGFFLKRKGWLASAMLIVAQLPVMWVNSEAAPLMMVGLLLTIFLAVPAIAVSSASALVAMRLRPT